jgi:hypothetical protein
MKLRIAALVALSCFALLPGVSNAKGCLKGAAVGAVGGHVAGRHAVIGAAAGCAVGHHLANKKDKAAAQLTPPAAPAPAPTAPPAPARP